MDCILSPGKQNLWTMSLAPLTSNCRPFAPLMRTTGVVAADTSETKAFGEMMIPHAGSRDSGWVSSEDHGTGEDAARGEEGNESD